MKISETLLNFAGEYKRQGCYADATNQPSWVGNMCFRGADQWMMIAAFFRSVGL